MRVLIMAGATLVVLLTVYMVIVAEGCPQYDFMNGYTCAVPVEMTGWCRVVFLIEYCPFCGILFGLLLWPSVFIVAQSIWVLGLADKPSNFIN